MERLVGKRKEGAAGACDRCREAYIRGGISDAGKQERRQTSEYF
jgi:hypothetical protein